MDSPKKEVKIYVFTVTENRFGNTWVAHLYIGDELFYVGLGKAEGEALIDLFQSIRGPEKT